MFCTIYIDRSNENCFINLKASIESRWVSHKVVDYVRITSQHFVDHKSKNSHLSSPSVVKLNSSLLKFFFITIFIPGEHSNVKSIPEVTFELTSSIHVFHYE